MLEQGEEWTIYERLYANCYGWIDGTNWIKVTNMFKRLYKDKCVHVKRYFGQTKFGCLSQEVNGYFL